MSYSSLRRFIVKRNWGRRSVRTVRMADTAPGEVAEVDFGRLGMITDPTTGKRRVVWALIIVLSYSAALFCRSVEKVAEPTAVPPRSGPEVDSPPSDPRHAP